MKKLFIITTVCLIASLSNKAQEKIDLFGVSFYSNPKVGLKDAPSADLENRKYNVSEVKAFVTVPFRLNNERTTIITGVKWHFVKAPFDDFPNDKSFVANLHSIQVNAGINQKFSDKWAGVIMLRPTLASNFKGGISGDDFFLQGSAVLQRIISEKFKLGVGAGRTIGFGEPKTVFVFLLDYKSDKFSLRINAPTMLDLKYSAKRTEYGFKAELEGGQYHLSDLSGNSAIITNLSAIKFSRYNIGPTFGLKLGETTRIELSAGYSINRILKTLDQSDNETDYDLKNGGFVRVGFFLGK